MTDFYVRFVPFPLTVKGVTVVNDDGTFDIYINSNLDEIQQEKALNHELKHIKKDHFYSVKDIKVVEKEAI